MFWETSDSRMSNSRKRWKNRAALFRPCVFRAFHGFVPSSYRAQQHKERSHGRIKPKITHSICAQDRQLADFPAIFGIFGRIWSRLAELFLVWQIFQIWQNFADFSNLAEFWRNYVYLREFHKNDSGQRDSDVGSRKLVWLKCKNRWCLALLPLSRAQQLLCYKTDKQVFQHRHCPVHTVCRSLN